MASDVIAPWTTRRRAAAPAWCCAPTCWPRASTPALAPDDPRPRLLMSPRGAPLTQKMARAFAAGPGLVIVCGRFEGVDERVIEGRGLTEVSVGDYILSGGEIAALTLLDACVRLLPGVMGKDESGAEESFEDGLLEYPHYTRPREWEGRTIPEILLSGDHARIARWRREQAEKLTRERRPDLCEKRTALSRQADDAMPKRPCAPRAICYEDRTFSPQ